MNPDRGEASDAHMLQADADARDKGDRKHQNSDGKMGIIADDVVGFSKTMLTKHHQCCSILGFVEFSTRRQHLRGVRAGGSAWGVSSKTKDCSSQEEATFFGSPTK